MLYDAFRNPVYGNNIIVYLYADWTQWKRDGSYRDSWQFLLTPTAGDAKAMPVEVRPQGVQCRNHACMATGRWPC
jgi:hypothetical protein